MLPTSIVAMFCGPHDNNGAVSFRRPDAAIAHTRCVGLPLIICGDGNNGTDCHLFRVHAEAAGLREVVDLYGPDANTLSDARSLCTLLARNAEYRDVHTVHLVTDWWHMMRARLFLEHLLRELACARIVSVEEVPVKCHDPLPEVAMGEICGVRDFLAGNYGKTRHLVGYGKPCHQLVAPIAT